MDRIYFDNNATTRPDPRVREAVLAVIEQDFGNPSSLHWFGQKAGSLVEDARDAVAALLGAEPARITFTSGGTEANNLAIIGVATANQDKGRTIVTSAIEHPSTMDACRELKKLGFEIITVPVGNRGRINPEAVAEAINDDTVLVSIMAANNETGMLQPIGEIGAIAKERGVLFHTDAVQQAGKVKIDVGSSPVDLLSISAHKFYGPKGVGALWIKKGVKITPRNLGGGQEMGVRGGTENVPGVVGLGTAASIASAELDSWREHTGKLRDALEKNILSRVSGAVINGDTKNRVPNTTNISFPGAEGEAILINLDLKGVAVSTGSACSSGATEHSHVLEAMKIPPRQIQSAIRFSLGKDNTIEEVDKTVEAVAESVERIRSIAS